MEELENFIDRSLKDVCRIPLKHNNNIFLAQTIDRSTPSRKVIDANSDAPEESFETLKMEIESGVLLLKLNFQNKPRLLLCVICKTLQID